MIKTVIVGIKEASSDEVFGPLERWQRVAVLVLLSEGAQCVEIGHCLVIVLRDGMVGSSLDEGIILLPDEPVCCCASVGSTVDSYPLVGFVCIGDSNSTWIRYGQRCCKKK